MIWASLAGLPFGFIDWFLVPVYWHPESLFDLIKKYGVGIESFVFFFAMAGIAAVAYEFTEKRKIKRIGRSKKLHLLPFFLALVSFLILTIASPEKAVYNLMASGAIGTFLIIFFRRDLLEQILGSAFIFSFFYFVALFLVGRIFNGVIESFYNLSSIWGIFIAGVPLEEILVAFFAGAFWSCAYEYAKSYQER